METGFTYGLDILLAVFTIAYIAKLLFNTQQSDYSTGLWNKPLIKRSLLNQQVARRIAAV